MLLRILSECRQLYKETVLKSYAQYGEDLILDKFLGEKRAGFYVDIGANDPKKFSNTFRFYKRGWRGINIEPNAVLFRRICAARTEDINLNIGIGSESCEMPFYLVDPDTLSTFDKRTADQAVADGFRIASVFPIMVRRLDDVLNEHCRSGQIDFMSLDVEGLEIAVLSSNDWDAFRPRMLLIEVNRAEAEIAAFMGGLEYRSVFTNGTNTIYADLRRQEAGS